DDFAPVQAADKQPARLVVPGDALGNHVGNVQRARDGGAVDLRLARLHPRDQGMKSSFAGAAGKVALAWRMSPTEGGQARERRQRALAIAALVLDRSARIQLGALIGVGRVMRASDQSDECQESPRHGARDFSVYAADQGAQCRAIRRAIAGCRCRPGAWSYTWACREAVGADSATGCRPSSRSRRL